MFLEEESYIPTDKCQYMIIKVIIKFILVNSHDVNHVV